MYSYPSVVLVVEDLYQVVEEKLLLVPLECVMMNVLLDLVGRWCAWLRLKIGCKVTLVLTSQMYMTIVELCKKKWSWTVKMVLMSPSYLPCCVSLIPPTPRHTLLQCSHSQGDSGQTHPHPKTGS